MSRAFSIALLLTMAAGHPIIAAGKLRPLATKPAFQAGNFTPTATPATITFSATNPATAPVVAGSSTATVAWSVFSGGNNWNLNVQASAPTFTNCPTVPISAVKVSCATATIGSIMGAGSATCAAPFQLSTAPLQVAGGAEGTFSYNYSVTLNFTLADSWKYIAETSPQCTLSLTYTANVP